MSLWQWFLAFLTWLSADPVQINQEPARAAAAVSVAYAAFAPESPAPVPPKPVVDCMCSQTCVKGIWKPDGRITAKCDCHCDRCKAERAKTCPDGNCPRVSGTPPTTVSPASLDSRR